MNGTRRDLEVILLVIAIAAAGASLLLQMWWTLAGVVMVAGSTAWRLWTTRHVSQG
ncbi:hypothetical protein [Demequina sp. NBRC 110055]|uniref:hypothetical protein n=1 Tax=Demequina sp. NBRC 110055 TaxID=1570344 RepID=UPI0013565818|nr:hypothetical protein [Demequina sp. NBRC 110055]